MPEEQSKVWWRGSRRTWLCVIGAGGLTLLLLYFFASRMVNRDGLRHALGLQKIPKSVSIRRTAGESWTDYLFEADLSLRPEDASKLLAGRELVRDENNFQLGKPTELRGAKLYDGFLVSEAWTWQEPPADVKESRYPTTCCVYFNEQRDRALVRFTSD